VVDYKALYHFNELLCICSCKGFYKIERLQIIESLLVLCHMPILLIENVDAIREMLVNAKNNTFDKKASKIDNFIALKDVI